MRVGQCRTGAEESAEKPLIGEQFRREIADMACFPWIQTWKAQEIPIDEYPHLRRWYDLLKSRPALRRGMALARDMLSNNSLQDPAAREILFGIKEG